MPSVSRAAISESRWLIGFAIMVLGVAEGAQIFRVKLVELIHDSSMFNMRVPFYRRGIISRANYCLRRRQRASLA